MIVCKKKDLRKMSYIVLSVVSILISSEVQAMDNGGNNFFERQIIRSIQHAKEDLKDGAKKIGANIPNIFDRNIKRPIENKIKKRNKLVVALQPKMDSVKDFFKGAKSHLKDGWKNFKRECLDPLKDELEDEIKDFKGEYKGLKGEINNLIKR